MPETTKNIPEDWHPIVREAIATAQARRKEMEEAGDLKNMSAILKEFYLQMMKQLQSAGVPAEEFITEHQFQVAAGLRRVVSWALGFAATYPPTHRKGIGEAGIISIPSPSELVFEFGGGGSGGPPAGPGGEIPEGPEPGPGEFSWVPQEEQDRAQAALAYIYNEIGFGPYQYGGDLCRATARYLGGRWGMNGKRGNPNDPSHDILAYYFEGAQPQLFDVLIDSGGKNQLTWRALPYPQSAGAVWLSP